MEETITVELGLIDVQDFLRGGESHTLRRKLEGAVAAYHEGQKQNASELSAALESGGMEEGSQERVGFVVIAPDLGNTDPNAKNLVERIRFEHPIEKRAGECMDINLDPETGLATVSRWPLDDDEG